ncbi:Hypothetical protein IALB_1210 [Ignavibacterium album JCM 16511]|uniref:Uncharacterized protein n=1 Tax=Ignavibacterium album (strain DSM 19864 / JCM 16511 / NBRC 101810 / Mat9-16) TaxID=945713 RepID=I0AIW4_IGNAJ|nr:Hypothetical protein IALB_1210 [Ignavibacterium album JCM 16511]
MFLKIILKKIFGTFFSLKTSGGSSLDFEAKSQFLGFSGVIVYFFGRRFEDSALFSAQIRNFKN